MASQKDALRLLRRGTATWTSWRQRHRSIPSLLGVQAKHAQLCGANLGGANLAGANLAGAVFWERTGARRAISPVECSLPQAGLSIHPWNWSFLPSFSEVGSQMRELAHQATGVIFTEESLDGEALSRGVSCRHKIHLDS